MIFEVLGDKGQVPGIARWRDRRVAALRISHLPIMLLSSMKPRECPNHRGPRPWRTLPNGNENSIPNCIVISTQKQKLETLRKHPKNPQDIFKTNQGTPNTTRKSAENQTGDASKTTHGVSQNGLGLSKVTQAQPHKPTKLRF